MRIRHTDTTKIGTKALQRYPRTGALKRAFKAVRQVPKFQKWLLLPLSVGAGRFKRLNAEMKRKPLRAQRQHLRRVSRDDAIAKELGLA